MDAYRRYRGRRVAACPETSAPAAVEVDAIHAALTAVLGPPHLRLKSCWNCHIAETFRRRFPDLVVDRPWSPQSGDRQR